MTVEIHEAEEWPRDVFKRKKYAAFLTELLAKKEEDPFILNINAEWGTGKTFFLENWERDIKGTYPTVYFNAWKKDFVNDPFQALISEMHKSLLRLFPKKEEGGTELLKKTGKVLMDAAPLLVKGLAKKIIGQEGVDGIVDGLFGMSKDDESSIADIASKVTKSILDPIEEEEASIKELKISLTDLLQSLTKVTNLELPMFVFIDELDRCRPLFAIETLEKAKHLFDIPEIKFVIATDTEQLSHSVKAIYGEGFGGRTYLRRFFSQEFRLPSPNYLDFAIHLFSSFEDDINIVEYEMNLTHINNWNLEEFNITKLPEQYWEIKNIQSILFFTMFSDMFNIDLRTQMQCYERLEAIFFSSNVTERHHLGYLIFLIIFKEANPDLYSELYRPDMSSSKLTTFIKKLSDSNMTIAFNSNYLDQNAEIFSPQQFALSYLQVLDTKKEEIRQVYGQQDSFEGENSHYILQDYNLLRKYKERVDLVGRLT